MKLVNIGSGNLVSADRIVTVVSPESAPIKRIIQDAKEKGMLIDATVGRKTKTVIVTDSDHIILCYLTVEKLAARIGDGATVRFEEDDNE
ncbi:MAG: DUF370 domain-containing protein [Clostridia bacterium]|nr:DUF370 domain-containing protein [Clostridia bacterium]